MERSRDAARAVGGVWLGIGLGFLVAGCEALGLVEAPVDVAPDAQVEADASLVWDAGPPRERHPMCDVDTLDPTPWPACACPGSRCIPATLLPETFGALLDECNEIGLCVPDEFIRTQGRFTSPICRSIDGMEGRCMSRCLPSVAAEADRLPQDVCDETHLCAPCFDPRTGEATGVCDLECDPGPSSPPPTMTRCCRDRGQCLSRSLLTEDEAAALIACSGSSDAVCVPDSLAERETTPLTSCTAYHTLDLIELVPLGRGVCVPNCLASDLGRLSQSSCATDERCVPCIHPRSGAPTGLCD